MTASKDFSDGQTFYASDADLLHSIGVPRFATIAARNSFYPNPDQGQMAWTNDYNLLWININGWGWIPGRGQIPRFTSTATRNSILSPVAESGQQCWTDDTKMMWTYENSIWYPEKGALVGQAARSGALSIPNATWTTITVQAASTAGANVNNGFGSGAVNGYTAPWDGWYELSGAVSFTFNASGYRLVTWRIAGSTLHGVSYQPITVTNIVTICPARTTAVHLTSGTLVELMAYQTSGAALTTSADQTYMYPTFTVKYVGM